MRKQKTVVSYKKKVEVTTKRIVTLSEELVVDVYSPEKNLSLMELDKVLSSVVNRMEEEMKARLDELSSLQKEERALSKKLNCPPHPQPFGLVPTEKELFEIKANIVWLHNQKCTRHEAFLDMKKSIITLLVELNSTACSTFEKEVVSGEEDSFILSSDNIQLLKVYKTELQKKRKELKLKIDSLTARMILLWDRLQVDQQLRDEVHERNRNANLPAVVATIEREILRCETIKRQNIGVFIQKLRDELLKWQDRCYVGEKERREFHAFFDQNFTDELLDDHEREVARLKDHFSVNLQLFNRIGRREELWSKMLEFEQRENNPNRLDNRGGRLLQEEKERREVLKELPKLDREIKKLAVDWEGRHGRDFVINDERYLSRCEGLWKEYHTTKENEKLKRQEVKKKILNEELMKGSKPVPRKIQSEKRRMQDTDEKPVKTRKLENSLQPRRLQPHFGSYCDGKSSFNPLSASNLKSNPFSQTSVASAKQTKTSTSSLSGKNKKQTTAGRGKIPRPASTTVSAGGCSFVPNHPTYFNFAEELKSKSESDRCPSSTMIPENGLLLPEVDDESASDAIRFPSVF